MRMRVLIVEDTPERQHVLRQLYRDHAWVLVHTGARAMRLLEVFEFDLISLDYDLADGPTGADVAASILAGPSRGARVIVHSMNPLGREHIRAILPAPVILPLASMVRTNAWFRRLREMLADGPDFPWPPDADGPVGG